jgi:CSLREA domain-containing protein
MVVSMKTASLEYLSFIVRLWRDSPEAATHDRPQWLAQVESMPGGEKHYFVTPEALVAYLREQLGQPKEYLRRRTLNHRLNFSVRTERSKMIKLNGPKIQPAHPIGVLLSGTWIGIPVIPASAASLTVTSLADTTTDDGQCTLREAILAANNAAANDDCGASSPAMTLLPST